MSNYGTSARNFIPIFKSKNHNIVDELFIQQVPKASPEVDTQEFESMGRDSIVRKVVRLKKFPFSVDIVTPDPLGNPYKLIANDQNPYSRNLGLNEAIGFSSGNELDVLLLHRNSENKIDYGFLYASVSISSVSNAIQLDGANEITLDCDAKLVLETLSAPNIEGVGHLVGIIEGDAPDNKAHVDYSSDQSEDRAMWLVLDTGSFIPRQAYLPVFADSELPAFDGVDSTGHSGSSGDEVIDLLVAYETGSGYGDIALTVVQGTPVTPPATPVAPTLSDAATHVASLDGCDSETRFCVLAEIFIDEDDGAVVINDSDITLKTYSELTHQRTPKKISKKTRQSLPSLFIDDYAYVIKTDGQSLEDSKDIQSSSDTTLIMKSNHRMIEAITGVAEYSADDLPMV